MKILGIIVAGQHPENNETYILEEHYHLDSVSFFARGTVKGSFKFVVRNSLKEFDLGSSHRVKHENHEVHVLMGSDMKAKIGVYAFCDSEYPVRVVKELLRESLRVFEKSVGSQWVQKKGDQSLSNKEIGEKLVQYQNPKNVDKLVQLESNLEETKEILHDNLEKLLARQGDLDQLASKSNDLNVAAKQMYKQSKKTNKGCCVIF